MADAAAAAIAAQQVRNELSKLPVWFGNKEKDTFLPMQWVQRVERARAATGWNDEQTMSFVVGALRGAALEWYDTLTRCGVNNMIWDEVRTQFLISYDPARTARTAVVNIFDVKQEAHETICDYHTKVCKAIDDIEALLPAAARTPNANDYPEALRTNAAFAALNADLKQRGAQNFQNRGLTNAFNHVGLQIFVANMKPNIRSELMKTMPATLFEAYQAALTLERVFTEPKKPSNFVSVQAISTEETMDDLEVQMAAIQTRMYNASRGQFRGRGGRGGFRGSRGGRGGAQQQPQQQPHQQQQQQSGTGDYNKCRYCKQFGHIQKFCQARLRANAPMVDKTGKPYAKINAVDNQGADIQQNSAAHQQTQGAQSSQFQGQAPQPFQNAPSYYVPPQNDQAGYFLPPDFQN